MKTEKKKKDIIKQLVVVHGYWYRNWRFPFFHYQEPQTLIASENSLYTFDKKGIWRSSVKLYQKSH